MTTIKNYIPSSYILSESFPNENGIREYFNTVDKKSFYTSLEEKSSKEKTSALEKSVEIIGNALEVLDSSSIRNNKDYLVQLKALEKEFILNHSTSTVMFSDVSNDFTNILQSFQLHYRIDRSEFKNELKFWLTPEYSSKKELALAFADMLARFAKFKDNIMEKFGMSSSNEIKRFMPSSYGINAVVTAGMKNWKDILLRGTGFDCDNEVRFVLINLSKTFKARHSNLFMNMMLEDKEGKKFGFDTLKSSEDAWTKYRIVFA